MWGSGFSWFWLDASVVGKTVWEAQDAISTVIDFAAIFWCPVANAPIIEICVV